MRSAIIIVPTCDRDAWFSDLAVEGIRKYIPNIPVLEFRDTDKATETDVPDDIRQLCRDVPYLRKQVDAPFIVGGVDDVYILDADCFVFQRPDEFLGAYSYQGHTLHGHPDYPWGLNVWGKLGHHFPNVKPLFCAGMFKAPRKMWTLNRSLMHDYLRQCMKLGYHRPGWEYSNVTMDQSLAAGLWRKTCPDNPLPALEYPLGIPTTCMKIFHACYYKRRPEFKAFLEDYRRRLDD